MTSRYTHLQPEDRLTLASLVQQGVSQRAITRLLGRSPSTICRELARNGSAAYGYACRPAQAFCDARRISSRPLPKLHPDGALWHVVCHLLLWRWSPQQIAHTLQPRGELKKQLIALLRWGRSGRRPRTAGQDRRGQIPDMVSIHVRSPWSMTG